MPEPTPNLHAANTAFHKEVRNQPIREPGPGGARRGTRCRPLPGRRRAGLSPFPAQHLRKARFQPGFGSGHLAAGLVGAAAVSRQWPPGASGPRRPVRHSARRRPTLLHSRAESGHFARRHPAPAPVGPHAGTPPPGPPRAVCRHPPAPPPVRMPAPGRRGVPSAGDGAAPHPPLGRPVRPAAGTAPATSPAGDRRSGTGPPGRRRRPSPPDVPTRRTSAGSPGPHARGPRRARAVPRRGPGALRLPR